MRHTRHHLQRGAFARAIATQKRYRLALLHLKGQILAGVNASQESALLFIVEDAEEPSPVVLVQVVGLRHMVEADDHLVAHAGLVLRLRIAQRLLLTVRGHRPPPREYVCR